MNHIRKNRNTTSRHPAISHNKKAELANPSSSGIAPEIAKTQNGAEISILWRTTETAMKKDLTKIIFWPPKKNPKSASYSRIARLIHLTDRDKKNQVFSLDIPAEHSGIHKRISVRMTYQEYETKAVLTAGPYVVTFALDPEKILRIENKNSHSKNPSPPIHPLDCNAGLLAAICNAIFTRPQSFL